MTYSITTNCVDSSYGVKRIEFLHNNRKIDVCFPIVADEKEIQEVISEVINMDQRLAEGLMTQTALCMYMQAPQSVFELMSSMQVGTGFEYRGIQITRVSKSTYNGMRLHKIAVSF